MFFISPPSLRAPSADRRETLPHDRKLAEFYKAGPKIRGPPPKKVWAKTRKIISVDFMQPRNGSRYPKFRKLINRERFLTRSRKSP